MIESEVNKSNVCTHYNSDLMDVNGGGTANIPELYQYYYQQNYILIKV